MINGVQCDRCGHVYVNHISFYGKICYRCGNIISSRYKPQVIEENEIKLKLCQAKIREILKKRWYKIMSQEKN